MPSLRRISAGIEVRPCAVTFDRRGVMPSAYLGTGAHGVDSRVRARKQEGARTDAVVPVVRPVALARVRNLLGWEPLRQLPFQLGTEAIDHDGTFIDVGCANGLLMETLTAWCAAKGIRIEPYGLDVVPELADLARRRLPRWADRIFIGNALTWSPPRRFNFVRTGLEYVPPRRRRDLVDRMMRDVVAVTGRLIVGVYGNADQTGPGLEEIVAGWGYTVAGHAERPHRIRTNEIQRVLWIDAAARTIT